MRQCIKIACWCIGLLSFAGRGYAQRCFGVANSEWSSMNSIWLNPASIAGSNEKITISIGAINIGIDNSFGTFNLASAGNAFNGSGAGSSGFFSNSGRSVFSMLLPVAEIRGPGVLVRINDRQSIALTTRIRVMNQLNNFDQSLYTTLTNTSYLPGNTFSLKAKNFNWTADLWSELGLTYGVILADNPNGQLKAGITLRYLGGIGYLSLKGNNLDLNYMAGKDSLYVSNSDLQYSSDIISTRSAVFNGINASGLFGSFLGTGKGGGLGGDIGLIYAMNPRRRDIYTDDNKSYSLKLSASVTDIGAITYNAKNNATVNVTGNGYITGKGIKDNTKNATNFKNYIIGQGFTADTTSQAAKVYLPSALLLGADYNVYKKLYVNATYVANLVNRQNFGNSYYNQVTITPRYDTKLLTIGLPITYSMLANVVKVGFGFRVAGFFAGSDDMLAIFSQQYGFGFYFGGYIPIYYKGKL